MNNASFVYTLGSSNKMIFHGESAIQVEIVQSMKIKTNQASDLQAVLEASLMEEAEFVQPQEDEEATPMPAKND